VRLLHRRAFELQPGDQGPAAAPTGRLGSPAELEPEADAALVRRTLEGAVAALPVNRIVAQAHPLEG